MLTKRELKIVSIPGNDAKIWSKGDRSRKREFLNQYFKYVCFGFLDTFVIASYRQFGSNPEGREAIEADRTKRKI